MYPGTASSWSAWRRSGALLPVPQWLPGHRGAPLPVPAMVSRSAWSISVPGQRWSLGLRGAAQSWSSPDPGLCGAPTRFSRYPGQCGAPCRSASYPAFVAPRRSSFLPVQLCPGSAYPSTARRHGGAHHPGLACSGPRGAVVSAMCRLMPSSLPCWHHRGRLRAEGMRLAALHGSWRSAILAIHHAAWTPPDTSRLEENPQPSERHGMDQGPCRSTHQGTCRFTMSI